MIGMPKEELKDIEDNTTPPSQENANYPPILKLPQKKHDDNNDNNTAKRV